MLQGAQAAESDAVLLALPENLAVAKERTSSLLHMEVISRAELECCPHWPAAFADDRKDRR